MLDMSRGHSVADADGILYHMECYDAIYLGKPVVDLDNNEEIYPDGKIIPLRGPSTVVENTDTMEEPPMSAKELLKIKHEEAIRKAKERGAEELNLERVRRELTSHIPKKKLKKILMKEEGRWP